VEQLSSAVFCRAQRLPGCPFLGLASFHILYWPEGSDRRRKPARIINLILTPGSYLQGQKSQYRNGIEAVTLNSSPLSRLNKRGITGPVEP
jgi:hypothetical protein